MADNTFHLEVVTPEKVLVEGEVDSLEAPGEHGEFQIMAGHTPFLTPLKLGSILYETGARKKAISITGGYCEVMPDKTVILAQTAELAENIDRKRAEDARDRAQRRLREGGPELDGDRARLALMRALNRLDVVNRFGK